MYYMLRRSILRAPAVLEPQEQGFLLQVQEANAEQPLLLEANQTRQSGSSRCGS